MKFFKHFTDARNGRALRGVRRDLGMAGLGAWWNLVELCAEKMEKSREETYTEEHCHFDFDLGLVAHELGTKSGRVQDMLNTFRTHSLLQFEVTEFNVRIEFPKLLESLDRDTVRARPVRATAAPKRKNKEKELDIEKDKELRASALDAFAEFPVKVKGPHFEARFAEQIRTPEDLENLKRAIANYVAHLSQNTWKAPKQSMAAFLGTKASGYFWTDFIAGDPLSKPKLDPFSLIPGGAS